MQTQKLAYTEISSTLTAYGSVTPLPSALKTLSVPYASRIQQVYVNNGQAVNPGVALLTLQPREDTQLVVKQAREELTTALQEQ